MTWVWSVLRRESLLIAGTQYEKLPFDVPSKMGVNFRLGKVEAIPLRPVSQPSFLLPLVVQGGYGTCVSHGTVIHFWISQDCG